MKMVTNNIKNTDEWLDQTLKKKHKITHQYKQTQTPQPPKPQPPTPQPQSSTHQPLQTQNPSKKSAIMSQCLEYQEEPKFTQNSIKN